MTEPGRTRADLVLRLAGVVAEADEAGRSTVPTNDLRDLLADYLSGPETATTDRPMIRVDTLDGGSLAAYRTPEAVVLAAAGPGSEDTGSRVRLAHMDAVLLAMAITDMTGPLGRKPQTNI